MPAPTLPTIEEQRRFWNSHWQRAQERKIVNDWSERRFQTILAFLRTLPGSRPSILDLGCGHGWYAARLAEFGPTTGIDLSPDAIAKASTEFPQAMFIAGNVFTMDLPTARFDVVVSQEVISHVEDQSKYVERAAGALRPGGHLILSTDNKFVMDRLGRMNWAPLPPEHIEIFLDRRALRRLLRPYFDVVRMTTVLPMGHGGILRLVNSHRLNRALKAVVPRAALVGWKERLGLGLSIIVLARKR